MLITRSAPTACLSMSQHSLMKSRCVLASCKAGLWSSFKHLAGFLKLKRMPRRSLFTQLLLGCTSSPSASSHSSTKPWIVTALEHRTSITFMMCSLSRVMSAPAENARNAETSVTKHKKYRNVCDQAEKMLEHARGAHIIFVDCPLSWAFATSHKASSRNVSCVRIHQGSPLSSAADDMEAGRLSS